MTNFFHVTATAINFNKPFHAELLPESSKVNARLTHLLEVLGLGNRLRENGMYQQRIAPSTLPRSTLSLKRKKEASLQYLRGVVGS